MKPIFASALLFLCALFSACTKNKGITQPPANTNQAKFSMDGKSYTVDEKNVSSVLYKTDGDAVKAMDLIIPIDNGSLKFYVADLKTGTISITKKTGTAAWVNSNPTIARSVMPSNSVALGGVTTVSNNGQTYVKYDFSGNSFYGISGSIEFSYNETTGDYSYKWNITFKDGSGRQFTSAGNYSGNIKTAAVKPKSSITDPTPVTPAPTVESINPAQGKAGDVVTITGTNFSTTLSENTVTFNGVAATVKTATATQITVTAPTATTGAVVVKVGSTEANNKPVFTYQTNTGSGAAFSKIFEHNLWVGANIGVDGDGNFYVSGIYVPDANGGNMNFQLFKINSSGDLVKRYTYSDFGIAAADKAAINIDAIDNNWNGDVFVIIKTGSNPYVTKLFKLSASITTPRFVCTIENTSGQSFQFTQMAVNNAGEIINKDQTSSSNFYKYSTAGAKSDFLLNTYLNVQKLSFDAAGNVYAFGDDTRYSSGHKDKIFKIMPDKSITEMPFVYSGTGYLDKQYFKTDKDGKYLFGARAGALVKFDINSSAVTNIGTLTDITGMLSCKFSFSTDMKWIYGIYMNNAAKYTIFKMGL